MNCPGAQVALRIMPTGAEFLNVLICRTLHPLQGLGQARVHGTLRRVCGHERLLRGAVQSTVPCRTQADSFPFSG